MELNLQGKDGVIHCHKYMDVGNISLTERVVEEVVTENNDTAEQVMALDMAEYLLIEKQLGVGVGVKSRVYEYYIQGLKLNN